MAKVFVVIESGWQYNDEYYYRACDGDTRVGRPTRVFTDRERASAKARELDIQQIKGCCLNDYASDGILELIVEGREKELSQLLTGSPDCDWSSWRYRAYVALGISDELADKILNCINIGWYDVVEVEID